MALHFLGAAKRPILSLLLACSLGGCAVYGPPYAAYDTAYPPAYGYATYPAHAYDGYPYGRPAYAYPPVTFDLGFSYYDRGPRHHGRHGWGHRHRGGHEWRGHHRGHGHHHGGPGRGRGRH